MKSIDWIGKAKAAMGAEKDVEICEKLGIKSATMSQHRSGRNKTLSDDHCVIIAEILGIDPAIVIADQQAERASPTVRKIYERMGKLMAQGAAAGIAAICMALPMKSEANQLFSAVKMQGNAYYVKWRFWLAIKRLMATLREAVPGAVAYG
jgi:hypothetical protein